MKVRKSKKQIAGNYSSPATEDTGIDQKILYFNKLVQGVIIKIFCLGHLIGNGSGF